MDFMLERIGAIGKNGEYYAEAGTKLAGGREPTNTRDIAEEKQEYKEYRQKIEFEAEAQETKQKTTLIEIQEALRKASKGTTKQTIRATSPDKMQKVTQTDVNVTIQALGQDKVQEVNRGHEREQELEQEQAQGHEKWVTKEQDKLLEARLEEWQEAVFVVKQEETYEAEFEAVLEVRQETEFEAGQEARQEAGQEVASKETLEVSETSEASETPAKKAVKKTSLLNDMLFLVIKLSAIALTFTLLLTFLFGIIRYQEPSMAPAIKDGDLVLYHRYKTVGYQPGDAIVIEHGGKQQVRRVVATAGDEVDITTDGLVINGAPQQEREIYQNTERYEEGVDFPLTVPEGQVFVLSDSRTNATDSRIFGSVEIKDTLGKVITVIRRRSI